MTNEDKRTQRLEALENNEKKKKAIVAIVIAFLIIVFLSGLAWGISDLLLTEGTMALPTQTEQSLSQLPQDTQQMIDLFRSTLDGSHDGTCTKLTVSTSTDISSESIGAGEDSSQFEAVLEYMKDDLLGHMDSLHHSYDEPFGTDFSAELIPVTFTPDSLETASVYDGLPEEDTSAMTEQELEDYNKNIESNLDNRFFSFSFSPCEYPPDVSSQLYTSFDLDDTQAVITSLKESMAQLVTVKSSALVCNGFKIDARANRLTDKLDYVEYIRGYDVSLVLEFTGELEALGTRNIVFSLSAKERFEFSHAGFTLSSNELFIEKGDTECISAYITADEHPEISWSISDSSIATVDPDGYVNGLKSSETPVTVTAQMMYMGHTYTQQCTLYVRNPISELHQKEREVTLRTGETHTPEMVFKPSKATIKTLFWFTSDEGVATVDENGVITAVGAGIAEVYAISLDGNYKASCTVTVQ